MTLHDILSALGLNPAVLVAGGFGGVLRALSRKKLKFREIIIAPTCGALAAAYLTLPAVHYVRVVGIPLPEDNQQAVLALAFLLGTAGMWVSDWFSEAVAKRLRGTEQ